MAPDFCLIRDALPPCRGRSTAYERPGLSVVVRLLVGGVLLGLLLTGLGRTRLDAIV